MPLIVTGTDAELDTGLAPAIRAFAERQTQVVATRDNLAAVSESTATARAAGERAATTKPARKASRAKADSKPGTKAKLEKSPSEPEPEPKDETPVAAAPASTAQMTNQLDLF